MWKLLDNDSGKNPCECEKEEKNDEKAKGDKSAAKNGGMGQNRMRPSEMKIDYTGKEERVEVEIGISNDSYYEIKSGIELGTVVKNSGRTAGSSNQFGFGMGGMNRMGGGMGGRMPGGMGGMNRMPGGMSGRSSGGMQGRR